MGLSASPSSALKAASPRNTLVLELLFFRRQFRIQKKCYNGDMGKGILQRLLDSLKRAVEKLPYNRKGSNALTYAIGDAVKSALAVFYFQHPSLLNFQQDMKRKEKRQKRSFCTTLKRCLG
jgi:hypothetical protein